MANDCLTRSFTAGFRWANRRDVVPHMQYENAAKKFAEQHGLRFINLNGEKYKLSNSPAILIYADNNTATDSKYHAVFLSDTPILEMLEAHRLYAVIDGFEKLMEAT